MGHNISLSQVVQDDLVIRVHEFVHQTRERFEMHILRGVVSKNHVDILVSAPPDISPSDIMRRMKGRVSEKLTKDMIKEYLEHHFKKDLDDLLDIA